MSSPPSSTTTCHRRRQSRRTLQAAVTAAENRYTAARSSGTLCVPAFHRRPCVPLTKGRSMSTPPRRDPFGAIADLATPAGTIRIHRLDRLEKALGVSIARLPFSIRVLLEAALRQCDGFQVTEDDVRRLAGWRPDDESGAEVPFKPARV